MARRRLKTVSGGSPFGSLDPVTFASVRVSESSIDSTIAGGDHPSKPPPDCPTGPRELPGLGEAEGFVVGHVEAAPVGGVERSLAELRRSGGADSGRVETTVVDRAADRVCGAEQRRRPFGSGGTQRRRRQPLH